MTMPKFEPVAEILWYDPTLRMTPESAGKIIDSSIAFIESAAIGTPLYTADQLTESYEAGKRDAIPEGWMLVPKEPTEEMELRGAECTNSIDWGDYPDDAPYELASTVYAAMLAAAPKGEE